MNKTSGFTLIELMIVIAIIGLLAGIAMPSYNNHINKGRRADAQASLAELMQFMERHHTQNGGYYAAGRDASSGNPTLPYSTTPKDGSSVFYNLSVNVISSERYTLSATPTGAMTDDECGTLSLNSNGAKSQSKGTLSLCWKR